MEQVLRSEFLHHNGYPVNFSDSTKAIHWYKHTNAFNRFIYRNFVDSDITSKIITLSCRELTNDIQDLEQYLLKFKADCQKLIEVTLKDPAINAAHTLTIAQRLTTCQLMAEVNINKAVANIYAKLNDSSRFANWEERETLRYIKRDVKNKLNTKLRTMKKEIHYLRKTFTAVALNNTHLTHRLKTNSPT